MKKSTLLHLRFPFSFFLLPVFLLACGIAESISMERFWLVFFILHFLVYPASNGFNSYFDKDEQSIGGLKHPPKVLKELYWYALVLDGIGIVLALSISVEFAIMVFVYGMISKAYSHPSVRLKKYAIGGWLAAGIFQGYFTFLMAYIALAEIPLAMSFVSEVQVPGILSSLLLLGSYPMTQVYQHEEDQKRGDRTMSILLGIKGTFHFTAIMFTIATTGFFYYFFEFKNSLSAILFMVFLSPVLGYFGWWYLKVNKDVSKANFEYTMRLNFISSLLLNMFFIYLWLF